MASEKAVLIELKRGKHKTKVHEHEVPTYIKDGWKRVAPVKAEKKA